MATLGTVSLAMLGCQSTESGGAGEDVAEAELAQVPTNPDKVALIAIHDQNDNPIIHVVTIGSRVPTSLSGVNAGTEYWYTNTTSTPTLTGLSYRVTSTDRQSELDAFVSGWSLNITCAQDIGETNWATWSSGTLATGTLFRAADPTSNDSYMGLYLEYASAGRLGGYAWYRKTLLGGGFAYYLTTPPSSFTAMTSTAPTSMEAGTWKYSLLVAPP
ncbi:Hypothetical protein A7982_01156 [Minicystis rosea]|nr:Hypothetical protein A7982_01156 [Minicystis rosea]